MKSQAAKRRVSMLLLFVASVLIVDALIGDRGLIETIRARREYARLQSSLHEFRMENSRLRAEIKRLREDPRAIEGIARRELGLIRPGEVLFVIKDVPRGSGPGNGGPR